MSRENEGTKIRAYQRGQGKWRRVGARPRKTMATTVFSRGRFHRIARIEKGDEKRDWVVAGVRIGSCAHLESVWMARLVR